MDNGEQMIVVRLNSDALAPRLARAAIQEALSKQPADVRGVAVLLADEIITNAVVHCGGRIEMSLEESPERIRIEISDTSTVPPLVRSPTAGGERGRGMLIVDSLASSWGVINKIGGKSVWFQLDIPGAG